jgi:hypothetical protein
MRLFRYAWCGALLISLAACKDILVVDNANQPDRDKLLGTAADLQNFIGGAYVVVHQGTLGGGNDALQPQMGTMSLENVSGLANFAMGPRSAIPRSPIANDRGGQGNGGNYRDFLVQHRAARMASLGLGKLKTLTLGTPEQDARARAFARFVQGVALGNLALAYDSASILSENDGPSDVIPLSSYGAVMPAALAYLDSAIAVTNANSAGFPLPSTWINGNALTATQFIQLIRSYKARFRAGVARSPAERAAVDWTQVIADANAGITADFNIAMAPSASWDVIWVVQHYASGSAAWHQMSQFILGMADTSGGYDTWLATPPANRVKFVVVTPDQRLPQGTTRALQNADARAGFASFYAAGTNPGRPYVRNRPAGADGPGDPFGISMYDFYRSRAFFLASRIGNYPVMTAAEIRLLAAEGYLRQNDFAQAMAAINVTRSGANYGGLPALVGIADTLTPVPGGAACVPRVPNATAVPAFTRTKCGNIWDALKWEYRLETMYTGYGMWYFAERGWGDLPEGTAINWPVPYQEMDARQRPFYGLGGVGQVGGSGRGNYGLFAGGVY